MAKTGRIRRGGVAAMIVAALFMSAAPAAGHAFTVNTFTTITYSQGSFSGVLTSPKSSCTRDRKVRLFKVVPGEDDKVGETKSDDFGNWSIPKPNADGNYYVKVKKRIRARYGHHHQCNGKKSETINV